jgi:16S rRNA (adenine(1408)-N(1))-methyltransferase
LRSRLRNLLFVRAAAEELPSELTGVADEVTVILPWGSLLAAVARPVPAVLAGVRRLSRPGARLTVVLAVDPARDRAEAARLGLPALDAAHFAGPLAAAYGASGFTVDRVRAVTAADLARWPSTWARRLAHGRDRTAFEIQARTGQRGSRRVE